MKNIVWILLLFGFYANAQTKSQTLTKINQDIWIPFQNAYANLDSKTFMSLHTKDLIRGVGSDKNLMDLTTYASSVKDWFKTLKKDKTSLKIEFRFSERIANEELASEMGIYELTMTTKKGKSEKFYGKFHVFLRKQGDVWKVAIDYDSNENKTIDNEDFIRAYALDDFKALGIQ